MIRARLAQPSRSGSALRVSRFAAQSAKRPAGVSGLGGPSLEQEPRAVLFLCFIFFASSRFTGGAL